MEQKNHNLYHKYRPKNLDEFFGNDDLKESLQRSIEKSRKTKSTNHAYLFTGQTGCGKTTLGRILAREFGAEDLDFHEIDSADFRGIDTIRELRKKIKFQPIQSKISAYLLDECHKLSNDAQNALLKMLEETPAHVYIILATTDPQKLLPTVKNRCQKYEVKPLSKREGFLLLRKIVKEENENLTKEIYTQIYETAEGRPRELLQKLEQVLSVSPERRMKVAKETEQAERQSIELCRALIEGRGWRNVQNILKGLEKEEPESVRRAVMGYAKSVLLNKDNERAGRVLEEFLEPLYDTGFPGLVYACYAVTKN